jgi:hypothetical protein
MGHRAHFSRLRFLGQIARDSQMTKSKVITQRIVRVQTRRLRVMSCAIAHPGLRIPVNPM